MDTVELTKKLISIPSYVDSKNNESKLGQWIYNYLKTNSNLIVKKEYLSKDRFNVVAYNNKDPDLLISGHIDTVQPNQNQVSSWYTLRVYYVGTLVISGSH